MKDVVKNIIFSSILFSISVIGMVIYVNYKDNYIEEKLLDKYNAIEKVIDENIEKIGTLEDTISKQSSLIDDLDKSLDKLKNNPKEIKEIREQLLGYKKLNEEYLLQITELKEEIINLSNNETITNLINDMNSMNDKLENAIDSYNYDEQIKNLLNRTEYLELLLPAKFEIDIDHAIKENETYEVDVRIENILDYDRKNIVWKIEDETIAKIDSNGVITALKPGITKVIATYGKYESIDALTAEALPEYANDIELYIMGGKANYKIGETETIRVNYIPNDIKNRNGIWTSSNENIISVDQTGTFKCLAKGNSIIKFTTVNNIFATRTVECIEN